MRPEEHLERLIEQCENGENPRLFLSDEIAEVLEAAESLRQLQKVNVPPDFAHRLEGEIRARVRSQRASQQLETGRLISLVPSQGVAPRPRHSQKRRAWGVALGAVAVLLIAFASLLTLSAHGFPGNAPSESQQAENQETLTPGNAPQNRADAAISQLRSSLADLSTVVDEGRGDGAIQQALNTVSAWTSNSREAVSALPAGSELQVDQQSLKEALAEEDQTLRLLLKHVDWPMKVAFTRQLGVLGDPVPTVIHVTALAQINETLLVTLTGTNFAPGARLVIDGKAMGIVSQRSASLLVAVVGNDEWSSSTHTVGMLNPDGTAAAAQVVFHLHDNDHDSSGGSNGPVTPTPDSDPTPRPDE
jgi:hypothetical protein